MVEPSNNSDLEPDNPNSTAPNSDGPTKISSSVAMDSSPVTPSRLVYVRRRLENNPNSSTDSQSKQPTVSGVPPPKTELSPPPGSLSGGLDWEDRYHQLQILLNKLDESDPKDYVQMLRSLPSLDLSRHAVQLEKRSIQLSLEEAKEMQRVAALNVLGRSLNNDQNSPPNSKG
ncbi:PREDICTED: uncharacterized protein LOC104804079 [Tarenaya hassleriana]|uniref:uncharacterized protein LOC104804079 n=1 Tax=Tarenaya hassleriana TaxID=28532 RepID=UPI00053CA93A|nr:PREDICTED: uncharacterized protein LOC104804079 [Tarenaya hassleriana]XP_010526539.1 PREDICTED: uncharacterized protein LOC104804079 [Tarenaya hassleriana]XP_010526540.1 PREDICTED: uncharacterized protein LOC104804079 [Tarenaya hassleriana]XP_010526541.1 PREDICTED: uncharacterized protein LOC104804079 [Tarenaya hassleriana]XP_010526542.1 PREDICTED: uncharacterized protein LOC104804079 [Tarenaya hassleriana]